MTHEFKDKIVLVTGGTGTIGSALVRELLKLEPKQIRILSRNDSSQYHLLESLGHPKNVRALIGDIRDLERLKLAFENVDIVFHAAALKHVPLCEYNPLEAVKTNILGSQNVIDAAFHNRVKKVIAISTDKAVDPHNVMGVSKLMMEKLFINTNFFSVGKTQFSCVRFGNVAWANGSVLSLWQKQIQKQGVLNITNPNMTRFLMSIGQAVDLTLKAAELSQGGEIFIFKMPSIKLRDLAKLFLAKYYRSQRLKIETIGLRPGEKMTEELFSINDLKKQVLANEEMFILIPEVYIYNIEQALPKYRGYKIVKNKTRYSSENSLNLKKIKEII